MSHTPHNKLKNYCDKLIKMYSGLGARTTQNMAVGATYLEIYIYIYKIIIQIITFITTTWSRLSARLGHIILGLDFIGCNVGNPVFSKLIIS